MARIDHHGADLCRAVFVCMHPCRALPEVQGNLNSPKGSGWDTWTGALNEGYGRFAQTRLDFSAVDSAQEGDAVASVKVSAVDTPVKVAA